DDLARLPSVCSQAVELISTTDVCSQLQAAISESLDSCFGSEFELLQFAVRSSAAGEDGAESSSAGQMETVLGVTGLSQIVKAVKQCWASAYSHQAVEYRRQHGQPISVLVGVVIQQLVPADTAGVMFTADPISGSISSVVINANYGLGESVVSGRSDPDTITVNRDPEFLYDPTALQVGCVTPGEKKLKIVMSATGELIEKSAADGASAVCLTDKMILKLAALSIELDKHFGAPRDIEWAIVGEDVFLLQVLTVCMGARQRATYLPKCLPSNCNHHFICLLDLSTIFMTTLFMQKDSMEISLLGGLLPEFTVQQIEKYYGRPKASLTQKILNFIKMIKMWYTASRVTTEWERKIPSYTVGPGSNTAADLYQCLCAQLADYETVWVWTLINSGRSGNITTVLMSIIGGEPSGWTSDHYGDLTLLLSKCQGVYSAEVPHAMENIAREIVKTGIQFTETFLSTSNEDCLKLLRQQPNIEKLVNDFLDRHGHRCLREAELREKSWRSAPEKFISALKTILKTKSYEEKPQKNQMSVGEILNNMKTKLPSHK
ncbi:unnamed protein product, partial [Candidula unifasciata]